MIGTFADAPPYWLSAPPAPETSKAEGTITTDVAVVGAGFSGLITALELASRGRSVVVLEAEQIGHGGSGRNHGQCIPVFRYLDANQLPKAGFGLLLDSGRRVFDLVDRYAIRCEAVRRGTLHAAHAPDGLERLRAQHAFYQRLGKAGEFLDADATADLMGSDRFLGGWVHPDGGHLNPLAYVRGLASAAIRHGVSVFTQSRVRGLEPSRTGGWRVRLDDAEITAGQVAFMVNGYAGPEIPAALRAAHVPVISYGLASAPLSHAVRQRILPEGHNAGDTHRDPMFFRIDDAGRIITGGLREMRRGRDFAYTSAFMTRRFADVFSNLPPLEWTHMWTGALAVTLDQRPRILRLDDGVFALTGFSGRGVPTTAALGTAFANVLLEPSRGARWWPVTRPRAIPARTLLGTMVQTWRGPLNRLRDRL